MEADTTTRPSPFVHFLQNVKRLPSRKKLGGVCAGLAKSSDNPAWFFRVMFITTAILYVGLIGYIALWIFMPVEYEFRGPDDSEFGAPDAGTT